MQYVCISGSLGPKPIQYENTSSISSGGLHMSHSGGRAYGGGDGTATGTPQHNSGYPYSSGYTSTALNGYERVDAR